MMHALIPAERESADDEGALLAYITWLFFERRLACLQLYPNAGADAECFVMAGNAGWDWHFPTEAGRTWADKPQPSTRAKAVMALVGVDWEGYPQERRLPFAPTFRARAPLPAFWPAADFRILSVEKRHRRAFDRYVELNSVDDDHPDLSPEADKQREACEELAQLECRSINGLKAKARALLLELPHGPGGTCLAGFASERDRLAWSLAQDLLRVPDEPRQRDPVFEAIEVHRAAVARTKRAHEAFDALEAKHGPAPEPGPGEFVAEVWSGWVETIPELQAALDDRTAAMEAEETAHFAVVTSVPTTEYGWLSLFRYACQCARDVEGLPVACEPQVMPYQILANLCGLSVRSEDYPDVDAAFAERWA